MSPRRDKIVRMSNPSLGSVDEPAAVPSPVTDDVLRAVRVMIDAYQLSAERQDVDVFLDDILDHVAKLVAYDAAGIYLLGRKHRKVRHWRWRGDAGPARGRQDPVDKGGAVDRAMERGEPVLANCAAEDETPGRTEFESCLVVPIIGLRTVMMGVLELRATRPGAFDARAVEILQLFGTVVAGGIERARLKDEVRDKHRVDSEFMVARQVMEELIPHTIPTMLGFDIAGVNEASFEVGGDYYEFIPLSDDRWAIIVADVVGKGIGAALLVSAIRASLYALVGLEMAARAIMRRTNRFFYDSVEDSRYVTLFYGVLDVPSRRMIYVNAGHPPPVVLRQSGEIEKLESGGVPLGMFETPRYFEGFTGLDQGDLMVFYTDGIVESSDAHDEPYGEDRLMSTLGDVRTESAEAICRHVMDDVRSFSFGRQDDRTLLVLKAN
jgi:sigma-B regulation protein RsbU (phosphoserine phosphatase)